MAIDTAKFYSTSCCRSASRRCNSPFGSSTSQCVKKGKKARPTDCSCLSYAIYYHPSQAQVLRLQHATLDHGHRPRSRIPKDMDPLEKDSILRLTILHKIEMERPGVSTSLSFPLKYFCFSAPFHPSPFPGKAIYTHACPISSQPSFVS